MEKKYYVYIYFDNDTPIYVGKGKNDRYKKHLVLYKKSKSGKTPFYDKLKSMEKIGKKPIISIVETDLTNNEALKLEYLYEQKIGTRRDNTGPLFNLNPCGVKNPILKGDKNPMYGKTLYDIWLKKYGKDIADDKLEMYKLNMSKSKKNTKHSTKTKKTMSNARIEWHKNKDEAVESKRRDAISQSWNSERSKQQSDRITELNKSRTGTNHHKSSKCIVEGKTYESISAVQRAYGLKNHNAVSYRLKSDNFPEWNKLD